MNTTKLLSRAERLILWKEKKSKSKSTTAITNANKWAKPRRAQIGKPLRRFSTSSSNSNHSESSTTSNDSNDSNNSNDCNDSIKTIARGVRRRTLSKHGGASRRNNENVRNNTTSFTKRPTSKSFSKKLLVPKITPSISSPATSSPTSSTASTSPIDSNILRRMSNGSTGRPPLSPIHTTSLHRPSSTITSKPSTISNTTTSTPASSPILVDEMDMMMLNTEDEDENDSSRQSLSSLSSLSSLEISHDAFSDMSLDSFYVEKRRGGRRRRQSMQFDASSLQSFQSEELNSTTTENDSIHLEEVDGVIQEITSTTTTNSTTRDEPTENKEQESEIENDNDNDDNETPTNQPTTTLTVPDRTTGTIGRLLSLQLSSRTNIRALNAQLNATQLQLNQKIKNEKRNTTLISTMTNDYKTMIHQLNQMKKDLLIANEKEIWYKKNALEKKAVVVVPDENTPPPENDVTAMKLKIKTLQFENEIMAQEMNQQKNNYDEDLEEIMEEKTAEQKEIEAENKKLENEIKLSKTQSSAIVENYTAALKQALARNSDLSQQLILAQKENGNPEIDEEKKKVEVKV